MTTAGEHAVPDRQHAETYLRLQAEAELRKALAFPRYRAPRPSLLYRRGLHVISTARRRQRRAVAMRRLSQARSASRLQQPQFQVTWLRASRAGALLTQSASWLGRALARVSGQAALGVWRIGWQLRRRPSRAYQPPPAQQCLRKLATLAAALADVGAIDEVTAESVIEDMRTALAARSLIDQGELLGAQFPGWHHAGRQAAPAGPLRAIPVGATTDWKVDGQVARAYLGTLILGPATASLAVAAKFSPTATQHSGHGMPPAMVALQSCTATDDRGGNYGAHFSGGGGDDRWDGRLSLSPVPPAGLHWLDFRLAGAEPVRVDLTAASPARTVTATSFPAGTAADRYLDALTVNLLLAGRLEDAAPDLGELPKVVEVASCLLAAGAIAADSPSFGRLSAAAALLGLSLPTPLAEIRSGQLPVDWLSIAKRRDNHDGPTGVIAVAGALPELDGACCVVTELRSEPEQAIMQVHARGWPQHRHLVTLPTEPFRWSARDDVGGWYMIGDQGSSSSGDEADLELVLMPAIDPMAHTLEVILTGRTGEVSVVFPLDWQEEDI